MLPERIDSSHIFPVAFEFVGIQLVAVIQHLRNDILAEIMVGIRILNVRQKQFAKLFPVKNIDTHGSKIALWFFRFFFEVNDTSAFVGIHDTETAGFFQWNLNDSDGGISTACLVVSKHSE